MIAGGFTWLDPMLTEQMKSHDTIQLPMAIVVTVILSIAALVFFIRSGRKTLSKIPDEKFTYRNFWELLGEFVYGLCENVMGKENAKRYFPVMATLFVFIFFSNIIGLVPGFLPPTENLNTTLAAGLFVFVYYNFQGFKEHGIGYIKHFMGPVWYLAPLIFAIELISHLVRPLTLALRLRGNMMGDHLVMGVFNNLVEWIVPVPIYFLGTMVCTVQALVFTLLTMVYVSLSTSHDH
jgi:F-type H+-transporting ATPase subunit a